MKRTIEVSERGKIVAERITTIRRAKDLSFAELSRRCTKRGRDIPPLGLRRIEACERRVDVDDLAAIADSLGVAVWTLYGESPSDTGTSEQVSAEQLAVVLSIARTLAEISNCSGSEITELAKSLTTLGGLHSATEEEAV